MKLNVETFDIDETVVVFFSDHGGVNKGHGGQTLASLIGRLRHDAFRD